MDDQDIDKQVIDQLYWDNSVNVSDVAVIVDDGRVTLKGTVPSFHAKTTAVEDAFQVRGVTFVDDELTVNYPVVPSDKEIKEDIESAFDWDYDLNEHKISVSVNEGAVKLTGSVDAYWKKVLAENDATKVNGVLDIRNELAIVTTNRRKDEEIGRDIEEALRRNPNVEVNDIDVKVGKGRVVLSGEVPAWSALTAAERSARYTSGVAWVDNELTIAYP
jgi:osmotically-inducible protein OsmY